MSIQFRFRLAIKAFACAPIVMSSLFLAPHAYAEICLQNSISVSVENRPGNLNDGDENLFFDGASIYTGEARMELNAPIAPGAEALILHMGMDLMAATTFEFFYEIDAADGYRAQDYADALNLAGYGAWYWDYDSNGVLEGADFDLDGDTNIGVGDYSPLGIIVELYDGDPGIPVGSGPGTLVHTAYSPIQPIESTAYSFLVTAPTEFDYLVIESMPSAASTNPRLIEIKHNGGSNSIDGATYGSSVNCSLPVHNYL